jgi:hypothetical protein
VRTVVIALGAFLRALTFDATFARRGASDNSYIAASLVVYSCLG